MCALLVHRRSIQYFDADRTSLYDAVNTLLKGAWMGSLTSDRQGNLFAERDIFIEPSVFGMDVFDLIKQDWLDDINIEQNMQPTTSFIELGGVAYSGATGTFTPYLANAPGISPGYRGKVIRQQGLALQSQGDLNTIAGNLLAQTNAKYPNTDIRLAGNYRNFDIAPQEGITLTVNATDTNRGISFSNKDFFVNRMDWRFDPQIESFLPTMSITELTSGFMGDTVTIPIVPPTNSQYGSFGVPSLLFPPLFLPSFPLFTGTSGGGGGTASDKWIYVDMYHSVGSYVSGSSSGAISFSVGTYEIMNTVTSTVYIPNYFNLGEITLAKTAEIYPIILPQYGYNANIYQYVSVRQTTMYDVASSGDVGTYVATVSQYNVVAIPDPDKTVRCTPLITTLYPRSLWALTWKRYALDPLDTYDTKVDFLGFFIHYT